MKKLYILLSIGVLIFIIVQFPHAMINPGELSAVHQKQSNDCMSCHNIMGGVANEKCIVCHNISDIGKDKIGASSAIQFHHQLSNQKCSSCHSEHQGVVPEHPLSSFKHKLLNVSVINNCNSCHNKPTNKLHTQTTNECKSCHQTESWKKVSSFHHDALLNTNNCVACHQKPSDDYHNVATENCIKCHSTNQWTPSTFDHSSYFKLDKNHNVSCKTCHTNNNYKTVNCFACHEHSEGDIISEHNEEGIYNISNCASCHLSGNEHDIRNNKTNPKDYNNNKSKDSKKSNKEEDDDDD